jgi:lysozyme family protein
MAEFLSAYDTVMTHEGGYANHKADRGGETYSGISRKWFPEWKGWDTIDRMKPLEQGEVINDLELKGYVKQFYKINFWDRIQGDYIHSQKIACFLFDWFINSGRAGLKCAQRSIGLSPDGNIGATSVMKINKYNEQTLIEVFKNARREFVRDIVKADPSQKVFLKGWLNRISSF